MRPSGKLQGLVDELSSSPDLSKFIIRKDLDFTPSSDLIIRTHGGPEFVVSNATQKSPR